MVAGRTMDLHIRNVVLSNGQPADILVEGERIVALAPNLATAEGTPIVEGHRRLALPGAVDVHVHLREPGGEHKENFATGTAAALAGGVTTVLAMPNTSPPLTTRERFERAMDLACAKAVCDFGLFVGATPDNAVEAASIPEAAGLKVYMGSSTGDLLVDSFGGQYAQFSSYPAHRVVAVHAEDEEAVRWFAAHGQRRPPLCASLGVAHALALAEHFHRRLHVCHVSTPAELVQIQEARDRGVPVTCEVTPHHLFLTTIDEQRLGPLGRMNPPLRSPADVAELWANLDLFDAVATDHAPHTLEEKHSSHPPAGIPGLETALPLLLTAVHDGRLTLPDVVRLLATGPAEAFGLRDKGHLAPGYHADIALVDPDIEWIVGDRPYFTRCGWSAFAGWKLRGRVEQVWIRGQLAFDQGKVVAAPGSGRPLVIHS